jgi:Flp pilus assembly pilin Flp
MREIFGKLWADDSGVLTALEFLLIASILTLGLIVGLTALRNAIVTEFEELANAILALSQGFSVGGLSGGAASVDGSQAFDTPGTVTPHQPVPPSAPSLIDVTATP